MKRIILVLLALFYFINLVLAQNINKVGVLVPLTGDFAKYGNKITKSLNKVKSKEIKFIFEDEACNTKTTISSYLKLSSINSIKYFLGPWCGSPQTALAPLIKNKNQIAILGSSAPRAIFKLSGGRMFSTQHSIEEESIFNAKKSFELGARKIIVLFFENDFSRAHEKAFKNEFRGEVLKTLVYQSLDGSSIRSLALQIKKLKPDSLYIPDALPLVHGVLKVLHEINLDTIKIFSVYSAQSNDVLKVTKGYNKNLMYSYPKIKEKDALDYFPTMASKIMSKVIKACGSENTNCGLDYLNSNFSFDAHGVLNGEYANIGLKKIKNKNFVWVK